MVNYNNDTTISTPPGDILKVAILERRAYFINAVEEVKKMDDRGVRVSLHVVNAALFALFMELSASLKTSEKDASFKELKMKVTNTRDLDSALDAFDTLNDFMYRKNLTRFDTRKEVDNDDIEANNKEHGF